MINNYLSVSSLREVPGNDVYAQVLPFKGVVFVRQREQRLARSSPELRPLFDELGVITRRLAALSFQSPNPDERDVWSRQITELTDQRESLEAEIATKHSEIRRSEGLTQLTPQGLQSLLPPGTALIDTLEFPEAIKADYCNKTHNDAPHRDRFRSDLETYSKYGVMNLGQRNITIHTDQDGNPILHNGFAVATFEFPDQMLVILDCPYRGPKTNQPDCSCDQRYVCNMGRGSAMANSEMGDVSMVDCSRCMAEPYPEPEPHTGNRPQRALALPGPAGIQRVATWPGSGQGHGRGGIQQRKLPALRGEQAPRPPGRYRVDHDPEEELTGVFMVNGGRSFGKEFEHFTYQAIID